MKRADVRKLFGEPPDVGGTSRNYKKPRIWKYGDIEIHFCDHDSRNNSLEKGVVTLLGYDDENGDWRRC
jgi:hypothetical protein